MQALRALLTPDAKRHKTAAIDLSPDPAEEDMYEECAQDDEDGDDEQPPWAKRQEERMMEKFVAIMRSSSDDLETEIAQINLKFNMAQATFQLPCGNWPPSGSAFWTRIHLCL